MKIVQEYIKLPQSFQRCLKLTNILLKIVYQILYSVSFFLYLNINLDDQTRIQKYNKSELTIT
ncbi:hypothetical protein QTP88_013078 [Uroleucon formosanum]